jgi:hypothetical protein
VNAENRQQVVQEPDALSPQLPQIGVYTCNVAGWAPERNDIWQVLRDNLDENGQGRSEREAAAGSDIIIVSDFAVRKRDFADARRVARR